jgi:Calcineurin-like phosphoesterase superfamily domain
VPDVSAAPPREEDHGSLRRVALLGGIYSNYLALDAALRIARERGADAVYALGDFGAFGPHPDRTVERLRDAGVACIQGNYEESLASGAADCRCGYTDPRDNHFAQISYDYTSARTSAEHKSWMGTLPGHVRLSVGGSRLLLCHGSPRRINEFLWRSTTPDAFIRRTLGEFDADVVACTHTGLHWTRFLEPGRGVVNVGALGRPANDGRTNVWCTVLEARDGGLVAEHVPVVYDHERLAREMTDEGLPTEFVETVRTGWWTTCLEILPAKERQTGRF